MSMKTKPTIEQMFDAYIRHDNELEQACRRSPLPEPDFGKLPQLGYPTWRGALKISCMGLSVLFLLLFVLPSADGYAMTTIFNRMGKMEMIIEIANQL